jgi:putative glutathione S-transferase
MPMGMLIDGRWHNEDRPRTGSGGEFVRPESPYRATIGDPSFPAQAGRYHLFVNAGCPWAYRTILYRALKRLDHLIGISFSQPAAGPEGWTFLASPDDQPEPVLGASHIHQVYTAADADFTGRCTVPVLWDLELKTIVNNESSEIIRMLGSAFDDFEGVDPVCYYPALLAAEIDELNAWIYSAVNNGVYRCGFARTQAAYDDAFDVLFEALDSLDARLATRRYLCGDEITEADWRLFATLVRFDAGYHGQFRCNRSRLTDFENLWPYTCDLYQQPRVAETVDLPAIKGIYYGSRPPGILPKGPLIDFTEPHHRS